VRSRFIGVLDGDDSLEYRTVMNVGQALKLDSPRRQHRLHNITL
jgi:hypothetical protein